MFSLAIFIAVYSYLIFLAGVFGFLYRPVIYLISGIYLIFIVIYYRRGLDIFLKRLEIDNFVKSLKHQKISVVLFSLVILQGLVNLIGVFGPELSFDALWYHLTLPKIFLINHSIFHISGGLLSYSDMPKLTEMLYLAGLAFGDETIAKLIHFSFGILVLLIIYKISRKFLSRNFSLIATIIFYSNLVVGWESITAYIDLARTFFELMALWGFLNWLDKRNNKWIIISGAMLGFSIAAKSIALESTCIFLLLFVVLNPLNEKVIKRLKNFLLFLSVSLIASAPWFVFSFLNTYNPFYPFFDKTTAVGANFALPNPLNFVSDFLSLFIYSSDPISPLYLITLPLILVALKKMNIKMKSILFYTFFSLVLWYLTPRIGGGRFILPYLPAFSILAAYSISKLRNHRAQFFLIAIVIVISITSIFYRLLANKKYLPVVLGQETKSKFLTNNLNFSFGDFYDVDGYFQKNIKSPDSVLLFGFHNLYYVDFPFIDSSWVKKGDKFNYIAVQNSILPSRFSDWKEIYYNKLTKVKLYSKEGQEWDY